MGIENIYRPTKMELLERIADALDAISLTLADLEFAQAKSTEEKGTARTLATGSENISYPTRYYYPVKGDKCSLDYEIKARKSYELV